MIYVTNGYKSQEFKTEQEAVEFIQQDLGKYKLKFKEIYNHTENDMQVIVYQYDTLYFETYIIHKKIRFIQ